MDPVSYMLLFLLAFCAGFIDSVVGGGGLIQLPALLIFGSSLSIPSVMGTNKLAAFSGTSLATIRYVRQTEVPWRSVLPAIITALFFSFMGARVISSINKEHIRIVILVLLIGVAIYTFVRKDLGIQHAPRLSSLKAMIYSLTAGAVLGFYDGFFGPGTGSFLILIFVSLFGFNFLIASVSAKLVNCATSVSALAYFIYSGQVVWELALPVAAFNMMGSFMGSRLALKRGSEFVRKLFLLIVSLMILKFAWDLVHW
jgi:uncharacterized protein